MRARVALVNLYEGAGFVLVRCTGHAVWRCPCGHTTVTTPTTLGRGSAWANCQALMKRTLRACAAQAQTLGQEIA